MWTSRGYSSYHGRKPLGKVILTVVLVLVILASVAFLLLQKYLVYDDSGTPRLQLPSKSEETQPAQSAASSSVNITIDQPKKTAVTGVQLSGDPTAWQSEVDQLGASDAFCVTMKAPGGRLQYQSAVSGAFMSKTAAAASQELAGLLETEHPGIARISCFRDSLYARANITAAGLKNTGGYLFYDGNSEHWLDPAKQGTADYLCAIVKECANLGFKEVLLTDFSYPTKGRLNKIDYGTNLKNENLISFLKTLRTVLDGTKVRLCVELPADVITTGSDSNAGLVLSDIAPLVDGIYAVTTEQDAPALRAAVKAASADTDFVPEVPAALSGEGGYLVVTQ